MVNLAPLDWAVLGLFLAAILALGFSAKLRENSALQFLAAGRSLTLPLFVATLVSTWYGGILGIGESVQFFGLGTWLLMGVPYYLFALLYALVYAKRVREADQISIPERLEASLGKGPAVVAAGLVFLLGAPAAHVLMMGVLVQSFTGWPLAVCTVAALGIGAAFLVKGGLLADVRVSTLAFAMMYVGFAVIVGWCLLHHPPGETWGRLENKALFTWDGGVGPVGVVTFFILGAWTLIDPGFHQRAASAESPQTAKRGILVSILFWMLFDILTITTGMYAMALMPQAPANPLLIFPLFGDQVLPPGLKAVFLCGLIGTILSAMVGYSLVSGASFGRDLVCRLRPGLDETKWARIGIGVAGALALALALSVESVVALWYSWGGCVIGALLAPVSAAYGALRLAPRPAVWHSAAMAVSFLGSFAWMSYGLATGNAYLNVTLPPALLGYNLPQGWAGFQFSLGTLLPGLALSALVLAAAGIVTRRQQR